MECAFCGREVSNTHPARHSMYLHGDVIVVEDACDGGTSVTNQAREVVERAIKLFGPHPIIYRDTAGVWDGLGHDGQTFRAFRSITTESLDDALAIARACRAFDSLTALQSAITQLHEERS